MSALHDSIHWIIDHLNVTQEEKDEQHSVVTSDEPQTHSTETEADVPETEADVPETEADVPEHENI